MPAGIGYGKEQRAATQNAFAEARKAVHVGAKGPEGPERKTPKKRKASRAKGRR